MLPFVSFFVVALTAQVPPPAEPPVPAPPPAQTMAVLPVTAQQVPLDELILLQGAVRAEVAALGVDVQPEADTSAHLSAALKIGASCVRTSTDCMTKVGLLADVTQVLAPTAIARGEGTVLDLRLVDVATGLEVAHVVDLLPPDEAVRRARIAEDVLRVLRPQTSRGALLVSVNFPDARIHVDDTDRGLSPPPGPFDLPPGEHRVRVTKTGFYAFDTMVLVRPSETVPVLVDLVELPFVEPPPSPSARAASWNTVGGMVAAATLGVCGTATACVSLTPAALFYTTGYYLQRAEETYARSRFDGANDPTTSPPVMHWVAGFNGGAGLAMTLLSPPGVLVGVSVVGLAALVLVKNAAPEVE